MAEESIFTQQQINTLQINLAAQEIITKEAIISVGKNAKALERLTVSHETLSREVSAIKQAQLTKQDISELLEISVNSAIVSGFKKLGWFVLLSVIGSIVAILTAPIHFK